MVNFNVLSKRYATPDINEVFSEEGKVLLERELWLSVLKAQKQLGYPIPDAAVEAYEGSMTDINLEHIREIEFRTKHDVKAKIEAFNHAAGGYQYIHLGMTSRDLTDNVEQIQIQRAAKIIFGRYVSVLRHLLDKSEEYKHIELTGRTHHQAAQTTLLGRRFAMYAEELYLHLKEFEAYIRDYPLRGIKGPVGTQFDMSNLLGSPGKAEQLEKIVAEQLGFRGFLDAPAQVYPRSLDYKLLSHLAACSSACESFSKTIRLMAGVELVTEGFREGQVGSSVMPHKMNTRSTERVCALSELLKMYVDGASRLMGDQWEEGDVSCSAVRRVILPDAFYASSGLIETMLNVLNQMGAYPVVIAKELDRYLPFLASTQILALCVKKGVGREMAHSVIKEHAVSEALRMREKGGVENNLVNLLAGDPLFKEAGISLDELKEVLRVRSHFVGNAYKQIEQVKEKSRWLLDKYHEESMYEPSDIL